MKTKIFNPFYALIQLCTNCINIFTTYPTTQPGSAKNCSRAQIFCYVIQDPFSSTFGEDRLNNPYKRESEALSKKTEVPKMVHTFFGILFGF